MLREAILEKSVADDREEAEGDGVLDPMLGVHIKELIVVSSSQIGVEFDQIRGAGPWNIIPLKCIDHLQDCIIL